MIEEKRKSERKRVLRRGQIVFRKGYGVIDCVVLDLSGGGALLRASGLFAVPDQFELRIDKGPTYTAAVCYRGSDTTGVRFTDVEDAGTPLGPPRKSTARRVA